MTWRILLWLEEQAGPFSPVFLLSIKKFFNAVTAFFMREILLPTVITWKSFSKTLSCFRAKDITRIELCVLKI